MIGDMPSDATARIRGVCYLTWAVRGTKSDDKRRVAAVNPLGRAISLYGVAVVSVRRDTIVSPRLVTG